MLTPYRAVLACPGAAAFSAAGFLARLPISMATLGLILLISGTGRSYALAGASAAALNLGFVIAGPRLARLADRHGQARVLRPAAAVQALAVGGLVVGGDAHAGAGVLLPLAFLAGAAMPSIGGMVRARWSAVLDDPADLHTAFSFESVLDEVIFIVGPVVATALATGVHPAGGLVAVLVVGPAGALALAAQRGTEPRPSRPVPGGPVAALWSAGLGVVVAVFAALGALFGAIEVAVVAFASAEGARALAGAVLALYAAGSMVAGIAFGAARRRVPAQRSFVLGAAGVGASAVAMPFAPGLAVLAVLAALAGVAIAPTLISGLGLVHELVPTARLTEGLAWATTGLAVGLMLGSAAAGYLAEHAGAADAFWAGTVAALAAAAIAAVGSVHLGSAPDRPTASLLPGAPPRV